MFKFLRLTRSFSRQHVLIRRRISSDTYPREISPRASTSIPTNFHAFSILFRNADRKALLPLFSLLTQINSLKRINSPFTSVVEQAFDLMSRYTNNQVPLMQYASDSIAAGQARGPYPTDTKAFLYYSTSREKPRIAGELRLRVISSDDAASFEWVKPLAIKWSAMVASTSFSSKILFTSVWKAEGRRICSRRLGQRFVDLTLKNA